MDLTLFLTVPPEDDGRRAVDALRTRLGVSRTLAKRIRLYGGLLRNGAPCRMRDPVQAGDVLEARLPAAPGAEACSAGGPEAGAAGSGADPSLAAERAATDAAFTADGGRIPYLDDRICVADKPAGWLTHPTRRERRSLTEVVAFRTGASTVHPVSRLDRGTSGLLVIALDAYSANALARSSREGDGVREYLGWVEGIPDPPIGTIDVPIAHDATSGPRRTTAPEGRPSTTEYALVRTDFSVEAPGTAGRAVSLVRFRLRSGRTHQIRVHALHAGFPLVGDPLYGGNAEGSPDGAAHPSLHAARLVVRHPIDGRILEFESPMPDAKDPTRQGRGCG